MNAAKFDSSRFGSHHHMHHHYTMMAPLCHRRQDGSRLAKLHYQQCYLKHQNEVYFCSRSIFPYSDLVAFMACLLNFFFPFRMVSLHGTKQSVLLALQTTTFILG
jgi:hypothetical protein